MRKSLLAILLLIISSPIGLRAQDSTNAEANLPDAVSKKVVSGILRWYFKPSRVKKIVPVAATNIKKEWLPSIKNIEFKLVPDNEILNYEKGVFLFEKVEREGNSYTINFGRGDPDCEATGDVWKFQVINNRVRLWIEGFGWGRACDTNAASPKIQGLKVGDVSPNELPGYSFFTNGKLRNLRLGKSSRSDVKDIFGSDCAGICDYDEKWKLWISYFDDAVGITQTFTYPGGEKTETESAARLVFRETIRSIELLPNGRLSFLNVKFPRNFGQGERYTIGDCFDENGFCGASHSTSNTYKDGYGLCYSVYKEETFNNLSTGQSSEKKVLKGDLLSISYEIPNVLDNVIYERRPVKTTMDKN